MTRSLVAFALFVGFAACAPKPSSPFIPAEPQRPGDPAKGYQALINGDYVSCGVPASIYHRVYQPAPTALRLEGRDDENRELPYDRTSLVSPSDVRIVTANCLQCHAAFLEGKLHVGLGNSNVDYTMDLVPLVEVSGGFTMTGPERLEWERWASRMRVIGPYTKADTIGVHSADNLAAILAAHRDAETLAWSDKALMRPPLKSVIPVDVPPRWHMRKKHAMFHTGFGRGDHARIMMSASLLCTDSVQEAEHIDSYFPDVRAFIASVQPPKFPHPVDAALAQRGWRVFEGTCLSCHGRYGEGAYYPNRLVPLAKVGTDPRLSVETAVEGSTFVDWFNRSFYGRISRLEPTDGYVAPPLDGIWATAPYFHNGSVPTLEGVLDSSRRPQYWTRSLDARNFDAFAIGWKHTVLEHGKSEEPDPSAATKIYDTTGHGYSNAGYTFADALSDDERRALLEYLKTL